jgi:hypothetical protein
MDEIGRGRRGLAKAAPGGKRLGGWGTGRRRTGQEAIVGGMPRRRAFLARRRRPTPAYAAEVGVLFLHAPSMCIMLCNSVILNNHDFYKCVTTFFNTIHNIL